jgi:polysaccharide deacetylase family protein (PEP-CTERM system associated)
MRNILSVDLEDYFHPTEVLPWAPPERWDALPSRIEANTARLLDLMEERRVRATFFVLGWEAERRPGLIRRIAAAGHEIACHSYSHQLVDGMTPAHFRRDTLRARSAIEDSCGVRPQAYRAPSYSITRNSLWALEVLAECGFTHDSSIYPISHDRYGIPGFARHAHTVTTPSGPICEVPAGTVRLSPRRVAPIGGGAYLRLFPYRYTAAGLRRLNRQERRPAMIYLHPWEFDPDAPRLAAGLVARLRSYSRLSTMPGKLDRLLREFQFGPLRSVIPGPGVAAA